jgi:hypothetical protein
MSAVLLEQVKRQSSACVCAGDHHIQVQYHLMKSSRIAPSHKREEQAG